jgi:hypothetical protein
MKKNSFLVLAVLTTTIKMKAQPNVIHINGDWQNTSDHRVFNPILNPFGAQSP